MSVCGYIIGKQSETTAKGMGLAESAGKEDPVELGSSFVDFSMLPHLLYCFTRESSIDHLPLATAFNYIQTS